MQFVFHHYDLEVNYEKHSFCAWLYDTVYFNLFPVHGPLHPSQSSPPLPLYHFVRVLLNGVPKAFNSSPLHLEMFSSFKWNPTATDWRKVIQKIIKIYGMACCLFFSSSFHFFFFLPVNIEGHVSQLVDVTLCCNDWGWVSKETASNSRALIGVKILN